MRLERLDTLSVLYGQAHAAAFSPSGDALACGGEVGDVLVYELPSRKLRWRQQPSDHWFGVVAFSSDGSKLACLGRHLTIHDAATGDELLRIEGAGPHAFAWEPGSERFAFGGLGGVRVRSIDGPEELWGKIATTALAFEPSGAIVAGDHRGRTWRIPKGGGDAELLHEHGQPKQTVRIVAVAGTSGEPLEATSDGVLQRGSQRFEAPGPVFAFAATDDGASFAAGGMSTTEMQVFGGSRPNDPQTIRWWRKHGARSEDIQVPGTIVGLALRPDGRDAYVSTTAGHHAIYRDGKQLCRMPGVPARISGACWSPDGSCVAISANGWQIRVLETRRWIRLAKAVHVQPGPEDSQFLVQEDERVVLIDGRTGNELFSYDGRSHLFGIGLPAVVGPTGCIAVGKHLLDCKNEVVQTLPDMLIQSLGGASLASDGSWAIGGTGGYSGDSGGLLVTEPDGSVRGHIADVRVTWLAFAPDADRLFYGCRTGFRWHSSSALRVLDAKTLEVRNSLSISCSDWKFLDEQHALACVDGQLEVWNVHRMESIATLDMPHPCHQIELSESRKLLLTRTQQEVHVHRLHFEPK